MYVQGDKEDWLKESVKIAAIYSEALVNIAASGSAGSNAGLFNDRSRWRYHGSQALVHVESNVGGRQSSLYFFRRNADDYRPDAYYDEVDEGPLAQRAWVCQERMSSPRTIHFGATQLF